MQQLHAVGAAMLLTLAAPSFAQDQTPVQPPGRSGAAPSAADAERAELLDTVRRLEARVAELEKEKEAPFAALRTESHSALEEAVRGIDISGRVEFGYSYNFRHGSGVDGRRGDTLNYNQLRGPDADENGFSFTEFELVADKPLAAAGSTGFHASATYGVVARLADADPNFDGGSGANAFDLREASFSWRAPFEPLGHLDLSVGKFRSPIGFETFGGYGLNWLVTRNPINVFGTPTTHTGARVTAPLSEEVSTSLWLVNGWETVRDENDGKNVIWNLTVDRFECLSSKLVLNASYGNVEGARQGDKRSLANLIWDGKLSEDLEFALDTVVGRQPDRSWHGAAGYLRTKLGDKTTLAFRLGWYADEGLGDEVARIVDASVALGCEVAEDLAIGLEYRHDFSRSGDLYLDSSGDPADDQDTLTAAFVYGF